MTVLVDGIQDGLSVAQALPIVGPLVFSPTKMCVSFAQMITGLAVGILFGMGATIADAVGADSLRNALGETALAGFGNAVKGFGSLFYASVNMASLGIIGAIIEGCKWDAYSMLGRNVSWIS